MFGFKDLADILNQAKVMTSDDITKCLQVTESQLQPVQLTSNKTENLETWELGYIANKITDEDLKNITDEDFMGKVTNCTMTNIQADNLGSSWNAKFDILVTWSRKTPRNNRQVKKIISLLKFK